MQQECHKEDVEAMVYLLLYQWLFVRLGDHRCVFCVAISLTARFQKYVLYMSLFTMMYSFLILSFVVMVSSAFHLSLLLKVSTRGVNEDSLLGI